MITFQNIMTPGLVFYDHEYLSECKKFCQIRNISYLPHIHSLSHCYYFDEESGDFIKRKVHKSQIVSADDPIFDERYIISFKNYEVFFVVSKGKIKGVVHYSDYNRSPVYDFIYNKLLLLERGLIHIFTEYSGLNNVDLYNFLGLNSPDAEVRPLTRKDFLGKIITLRTILKFTQNKQLVRVRRDDIEQIINLRNKIAHSDDLIMKHKNEEFKFDIDSYLELLKAYESLEVALKQVSNRLYFMKAVTDEDFSKCPATLEDHLYKYK